MIYRLSIKYIVFDKFVVYGFINMDVRTAYEYGYRTSIKCEDCKKTINSIDIGMCNTCNSDSTVCDYCLSKDNICKICGNIIVPSYDVFF